MIATPPPELTEAGRYALATAIERRARHLIRHPDLPVGELKPWHFIPVAGSGPTKRKLHDGGYTVCGWSPHELTEAGIEAGLSEWGERQRQLGAEPETFVAYVERERAI